MQRLAVLVHLKCVLAAAIGFDEADDGQFARGDRAGCSSLAVDPLLSGADDLVGTRGEGRRETDRSTSVA